MKPVTAILVALAIFSGCREKGAAPDPKGGRSLDNVSAADWGKLAGKKIFSVTSPWGTTSWKACPPFRRNIPPFT